MDRLVLRYTNPLQEPFAAPRATASVTAIGKSCIGVLYLSLPSYPQLEYSLICVGQTIPRLLVRLPDLLPLMTSAHQSLVHTSKPK